MKTNEIFTKGIAGKIITKQDSGNDYDIAGMITTFDTPDLVGDIMEKGCLTKFIAEYNVKGRQGIYDTPLPMYFQHSMTDPVGYWVRFEENEQGVIGYAKFYDTTLGQDVKKMCKDDNSIIGGFSIGFLSTDYEDIMVDDMWTGYLFKEITLRETSVVTNPAMPSAKITNVKNAHHKDGTINLAVFERSLRDAGLSRSKAKGAISALKEYLLIHIEISDEDDESDGMSDDANETNEDKMQKDAQKLLTVLDEIKKENEVAAFLKSLKGN